MLDRWLPLPRYTLRKFLVLEFLKHRRRQIKTCFEIGYASGDLMISLAIFGFQVYGYDFSIDALKIAGKRIRKTPLHIKRRITQLTANRPTPASSDAIIALEVLEHVRDDIGLIKQLNKILTPGGFFIFSVPAHKSKWGENDIWAGHYRRYEKHEIIYKLEQSHLIPLHVWSYGYPLIRLLDLMIHRNRKGDIKRLKGVPKEELTQKSGISRDRNFLNLLASWKIWVLPFFYIQKLFLNQDKSSAYLVIAQKPFT